MLKLKLLQKEQQQKSDQQKSENVFGLGKKKENNSNGSKASAAELRALKGTYVCNTNNHYKHITANNHNNKPLQL